MSHFHPSRVTPSSDPLVVANVGETAFPLRVRTLLELEVLTPAK